MALSGDLLDNIQANPETVKALGPDKAGGKKRKLRPWDLDVDIPQKTVKEEPKTEVKKNLAEPGKISNPETDQNQLEYLRARMARKRAEEAELNQFQFVEWLESLSKAERVRLAPPMEDYMGKDHRKILKAYWENLEKNSTGKPINDFQKYASSSEYTPQELPRSAFVNPSQQTISEAEKIWHQAQNEFERIYSNKAKREEKISELLDAQFAEGNQPPHEIARREVIESWFESRMQGLVSVLF